MHKSVFTVDVEDGVSIAMRDAFSVKSEQTDRVVNLTTRILELLNDYNTKATFFVLGQVAEKFPGLVKQIADEGHELGVHGYNHLQFFKMTKEKAFDEISSAKKLIEDISGNEILGHRAPAFSITPETEWGFDVIAEAGFVYDSSVMPIRGNRYGWLSFPNEITRVKTTGNRELIEVPMSTIAIMGQRVPVCGGGYLRLFPKWMTQKAFEMVSENKPAIVYIHPYEIDTKRYPAYYFEQLKKSGFIKENKMKSMWMNRKTVLPKLSLLLENYSFDTMFNIVKNNDNTQHVFQV